MYEFFEHTADLGLRIRADSLDQLFEDAAAALFSAILVNPGDVQPVEETTFHIEGSRRDDLLFDWLAELLFAFDADRLVFRQFDVQVGESAVTATARGESLDPDRHELDMEIKAITYHGLKVERDGDGWLAEVIVDI